ncbi:hypothetical protein VB735_27960 [Halotia wernerae UHCC 0503]|nr:hypothetical protein [Halotia wernerae UHCC 0503]
MQSTVTVRRLWKQPKFCIGQRTSLGKIVGVNYNDGWEYTILINEVCGQLVQLSEAEIRLLSEQEIESQILAEVDLYLTQLVILQQELGADLRINTPFGRVHLPTPINQRRNDSASRLSEPIRSKVSA